jgi:hypothetical protein
MTYLAERARLALDWLEGHGITNRVLDRIDLALVR